MFIDDSCGIARQYMIIDDSCGIARLYMFIEGSCGLACSTTPYQTVPCSSLLFCGIRLLTQNYCPFI